MNSLLQWRAAQRADRAVLSGFCCTTSPVKNMQTKWQKVHPKPWEFEVQSAIRGLRPPFNYPRQMLLGWDAQDLAAVSYYEELDGAAQVALELMAVSTAHRGKGGGYADELFAITLNAITSRAIEESVPEVLITGYVFEGNRPSQEMCRRHGLRHTGEGGPGVQLWAGVLPVAP